MRFNHNKKFIELENANFNLAEDVSQLDKRLSGIKWITPDYNDRPMDEINLLINTKNIFRKLCTPAILSMLFINIIWLYKFLFFVS